MEELAGEDLAHHFGHVTCRDAQAPVEEASRRLEKLGDALLGQLDHHVVGVKEEAQGHEARLHVQVLLDAVH